MFGLFVVVEGVDKSGKTTVVRELYEALSKNYPVKKISFPDRSTAIGTILDKYLKGIVDMSPEATHLLFTADRYEKKREIEELSRNNILICDRYSWSGITSTVAKGIDLGWCLETERLLPKADITLYLEADIEVISRRRGFGDEVLETTEIQHKIKDCFGQMRDYSENVVVLDATKSVEDITAIAVKHVLRCLEKKNQINSV
ncbi:putative thymidylate kinase [Nosema granulosis]|uniref:dTMP kinase n=1 Tax=Nosema granulosis TaxID=83296 RepID=A0A9P6GW85_9MICR|nr:putative thymidylate kinase [Nosema granulosis]